MYVVCPSIHIDARLGERNSNSDLFVVLSEKKTRKIISISSAEITFQICSFVRLFHYNNVGQIFALPSYKSNELKQWTTKSLSVCPLSDSFLYQRIIFNVQWVSLSIHKRTDFFSFKKGIGTF